MHTREEEQPSPSRNNSVPLIPAIPALRRASQVLTVSERRDAAAKEAKFYVHKVVRKNWSYDAVRASEGERRRCHPPSHNPLTLAQLERVLEWRERECDTDDSDIEAVDEAEVKRKEKKFRSKSKEEKARRESQLAADIEAAKEARAVVVAERRQRRRKAELQEMQWNEGLRLWSDRRDAWTGAKLRHQVNKAETDESQAPNEALEVVPPKEEQPKANASTIEEQGRTLSPSQQIPFSSPHPPPQATDVSVMDEPANASEPAQQQTNLPSNDAGIYPVSSSAADQEGSQDEPVVPIMRPYLPKSNVLVAAIKPSTYSSIYSKCVLQSLTPSVPINLADMTKAIVEGWKRNGEWPPPSTVPEPLAARRPSHKLKEKEPKEKSSAKDTSPTSGRRLSATLTGAMKKAWNYTLHPAQHLHFKSNGSGNGQQESNAGQATNAAQAPASKGNATATAEPPAPAPAVEGTKPDELAPTESRGSCPVAGPTSPTSPRPAA